MLLQLRKGENIPLLLIHTKQVLRIVCRTSLSMPFMWYLLVCLYVNGKKKIPMVLMKKIETDEINPKAGARKQGKDFLPAP